ncbi:low molecular weight protein arginine phosphatase [Paenibacillus sp. YYML68]|uniref:low molecular weight protein arginine phosphatase n=1 Tax=Paenibacillus sp. YYML68 TaxID=2909250 RepID=UPI002492F6A3|nr:low molecular weight protein arginine phosphatase [Paenibacillus sp. YYML68]
MNRILFVCTGNTCRSPMAEGMMKSLIEKAGLTGLEVRSAGVSAFTGMPVSDHARTVLQEKGCALTDGSKLLDEELVQWADLVLTMTASHKRHTIQLHPEAVDKVHTLKEYVAEGGGKDERTIAELESLLSSIQLKQALSEPITDEERMRIIALEKELPSHDISDPFGGPYSLYAACAEEIEEGLHKLVDKLKRLREA